MSTDDQRTIPEPLRVTDRTIQVEARYEILETLGRGGMGEVVAARDRVLGRLIAIKRMIEVAPSRFQVSRFLREARIQGWLDHPSIPPLHELASDINGQPYIVMKKLVGTTLFDVVRALATGEEEYVRRYPRERLLRAFTEVCLAIEFAHTRGVIHRDLKPSNIMLGEFGEVFVLDWGVAKLVGVATDLGQSVGHDTPSPDDTQAGAIVGTPAYMAPEQRLGATDLDGRADVFSLGRLLDTILRTSTAPERPGYARDIPVELAEAARAATAEDRDDRIASARELAERVQRYLDGDRDLAERRRLAREHLARARSAIATSIDDNRTAMQEAGRALALDPTLPGAADLVGRLMLEPPFETPPEVAASLTADNARSQIEEARRGRNLAICCTAFLVGLWGTGIRDPGYYVAIGSVIAVLIGLATYGARHPISTSGLSPRAVLVIAAFALLIVVLTRLYSPFLIAPSAAAIAATLLMGAPAYRHPQVVAVMVTAFTTAFLVPAVAELLGWIRPSYQLDGRVLTIFVPSDTPPTIGVLGLLVWSVACVLAATVVTLRRARGEDRGKRLLHLQAWRLRQLLPRGSNG